MQYESLNSKLPLITKLNMFCEKLDMSLTDTQLPMFFRLIELCMALYYGTLELPEAKRKPAADDLATAIPELLPKEGVNSYLLLA